MFPHTLMPGKSITFLFNGRPKTYDSTHANFNEIVKAVIAGDSKQIEILTEVRKFVALITKGDVVITEDMEVLYKGVDVPEYLAERIVDHHNSGYPVEPLLNFANKLMENPNEEVRNDLYRWLEVGKLPIYEDGSFVAYKTVNKDFTPVHKGPYGQDQSPGKVVSMPRNECDEDRNNTCSRGLHFCSYEYLGTFGAGSVNQTVIVLKIDPKNVTSIPTDYNLTKGRCCEFEVVSEIPYGDTKTAFKEEKIVTKEKVKKTSNKNVLTFTNADGEEFTAKQVLDAMKEKDASLTSASKKFKVARSTFTNWWKKAKASK